MTTRVLHLLDHSLPQLSGYSVRSHGVLRAQRAAGIDAIAISESPHVAERSEAYIDGVPYISLPIRATGAPATPMSSTLRVIRTARRIAREVTERGITVLHAHSPSLNGVAALAVARWARLPLVYEMRALWEDAAVERNLGTQSSIRYRAARALETWLIRRVSALVVISQGLHEEAEQRGVAAENMLLAPNGVDTSLFQPLVSDATLLRRHQLEGRIVIGYIGFFVAYEGIDLLMRGFAQVAASVPGVRLLLVGGGEEESSLRALAAELGVQSSVIFAGVVSPADVRRWYSICDVLVYPRRRGKLTELVTPLKPLEAMAMAKPVVAADVGGLRELIRDSDTGLLHLPGDVDAIAGALAQLAASPSLRLKLGDNARRFVCDERDWNRLGPLYDAMYRRLRPDPSPPGKG